MVVTGTLTRALYAFALAQMGGMACAASGSYVGETLGAGPHHIDDFKGILGPLPYRSQTVPPGR